jgi:hypothetical protein
MLRRMTRFNTDGTLLDVTRVPVLSSAIQISGLHRAQENRLISLYTKPSYINGQFTRVGCLVTSSAGDTIWETEFPEIQTGYMGKVKIEGKEREVPTPYPFTPSPSCVYHYTLGIIYSSSREPVLDFYDLDGVHKLQYRIEMNLAPPSADDRTLLMDQYDKRVSEAVGEAKEALRLIRDSIQLPEIMPPWTKVEVDDAGYIWLQIPTPLPFESSESLSYRILSTEGEYLGITKRPNGFWASVCNGYLLVNNTDIRSGEYQLIVYRIRPTF